MKLYTFEPAPNPQRVHLFLKAKGLELETETIDLMKKAQFNDAFKAINPRCTVPSLVLDDGEVLSEVVGICMYLDGLYPEKPMMGSTPIEKAKVIGWMHRVFLEGIMPVADALRNGTETFKGRALPGPFSVEQIPALAERGQTMIGAFYKTLNAALDGREYLALETFTQADIDAYCVMGFTGWVGREVPEECTNIHSWMKRVPEQLG